ncbi:DNA-deoxyinosine glycosylase [Mariprofundus sp. EBB-1]|uniref:DNA-deoxyinosine glycosylase n=1 Tax=Mariprofundus sp. EBB-1 TaxID=2650971 RepID=UPI000EF28952|nr:DNA-deoxyinosine glycosylase [Mariprofundus sp. EBB-1]RLL49734.1 DNA-deoxyinosine glycosylase [Mariprofundus sp. EBB-1]
MPDIGFPYVAKPDARVLILGSMPGQKSLALQQYYGHAQNSFWPIMAELFDFSVELDYQSRLSCLLDQHIALWDVAHQCVRLGSLDQAIEMDTVVANDFAGFFVEHPHVTAIFFNGRKAEQLFQRLIMRAQDQCQKMLVPTLRMHLLPSTSPAHASISRQQKCSEWSMIKETLEMRS